VHPGDVVVQIAQTPVANTSQLLNAVASLKPGEPAKITVQRGAKVLALDVVAAQRPKASRNSEVNRQEMPQEE
jgi:S1-C subfamily serine protease